MALLPNTVGDPSQNCSQCGGFVTDWSLHTCNDLDWKKALQGWETTQSPVFDLSDRKMLKEILRILKRLESVIFRDTEVSDLGSGE